jgi:hypothetical protein
MTLSHQNLSRLIEPRSHLNPNRRIRWKLAVATLSIALLSSAKSIPQNSPQSKTSEIEALMSRVGPPSENAVDEFKKAGMENVKPHSLTAAERVKIENALASLPGLNRRVLKKKLHQLAFVDGIPGEGTGLTSQLANTGLYDITLRASILDEPLSTFLTVKEGRVFTDDGSGMTVTVKGTGTDAFTYVLLHESTHVVDKSCGITPGSRAFDSGIWLSQSNMVPALALSVAAATYFRGGQRLPVRKAEAVYDSLARTPFVSLYATASPQEDFAELVAWHEILDRHHGSLVVEITDAHGKAMWQWEPLKFPQVQERFSAVDDLLDSQRPCRGLSWFVNGG